MEVPICGQQLHAEIILIQNGTFEDTAISQFDAAGFWRVARAAPSACDALPGLNFARRETVHLRDQSGNFRIVERKSGHSFFNSPLPDQRGDFIFAVACKKWEDRRGSITPVRIASVTDRAAILERTRRIAGHLAKNRDRGWENEQEPVKDARR
jgi:hypothetical protein